MVSALEHHRAGAPYFLYTASNTGSLAALVPYPALVSRRWPAQHRPHSGGRVRWCHSADVRARVAPDTLTTDVLNSLTSLFLLSAALVVCFSLSRQPAAFGAVIVVRLATPAALGTGGWGNILYASRTFLACIVSPLILRVS